MEILKKVTKVLVNTLVTLILIVGITFIVLFVAGIEPYVVESGSMQPTIETGSLCFINKNIKYQEIKENDIIAFKALSGDKVTHRAISITSEGIETTIIEEEKSTGLAFESEAEDDYEQTNREQTELNRDDHCC